MQLEEYSYKTQEAAVANRYLFFEFQRKCQSLFQGPIVANRGFLSNLTLGCRPTRT